MRLTFQDVASVGIAGVLIDSIVLSSTFLLSWWAGTRLFGLDRKTAMLIGAGSSICGAAAVMAAEPVVSGRAEQITVAVSTVVVFGTLAIFVYPALYHLNAHHPVVAMSPAAYGLFTGSTVHEVAQVVAAGRAISESAANTAVITKMVRVMMLAPFLVILSLYLARSAKLKARFKAQVRTQGTHGAEVRPPAAWQYRGSRSDCGRHRAEFFCADAEKLSMRASVSTRSYSRWPWRRSASRLMCPPFVRPESKRWGWRRCYLLG